MNPRAPGSIEAIAFGAPARQQFGIFHPAQNATATAAPARPAVLLCNPFGQEAIRAHRMWRVLAERLARAGHSVLRFDYYGSGDSMGGDDEADLDGWAADVHAADAELARRSGASRRVWIGMRLGASVALRAAAHAPQGLTPVKLIAWDPILDGARYLALLRQAHVSSLEDAFSLPLNPLPSDLARADANRYTEEAIGFAVSKRLRGQIAALAPATHAWPAAPADIVVLTDPDDADGRDLAQVLARTAASVRCVTVRHGTDWTSDTADNSALVPASALMQLAQQVAEVA